MIPAKEASDDGPDNLHAAGWLLLDMSLNIWALTIVKASGADYPAAQLVFLRAAAGLVVLTPWILRQRHVFSAPGSAGLHVLRIGLSATALMTSFFAIARLPFALFTAVNFTRPIVLMLLAATLLGERISRRRWLAVAAGLAGAVIAVGPGDVQLSPALAALMVTVIAGSGAVIVTRRLKGTPPLVMMTAYTAGLALVTAPLALSGWATVPAADWPFLLSIGLFAQAAQLCFLRAHWLGDAGVLGPVSYLSLVLTTGVGYVVFAEVPDAALVAGAAIIILAALAATRS